MTTNMRNPAEQAAYEFGRAAAKYEMTIGAAISGLSIEGKPAHVIGDVIGEAEFVLTEPRKRRGRVAKAATKAADTPKEPKAPKIARGVKRASTGPRTKGVKEAIVNLIGQHSGIAVTDIVSKLGFKETSVRATLMGLKKSNIAAQDDEKNWYLTANAIPTSNSEHQSAEPEMY